MAEKEKPEKEEKKAQEKETKKEKTKKTEKKEDKKEKTKKIEEAKPSKTYVIPLKKLFMGPRIRRARNAAKLVKTFIAKHAKTEEIKIDSKLNEHLYSRGKSGTPRKVKVTVTEEGEYTLVRLA